MPPPAPSPPSVPSPLHAHLCPFLHFFVESYESRPRRRQLHGPYPPTSQWRPRLFIHVFINRKKKRKYSSETSKDNKKGNKKGRGKSTADLFCEGCSPWPDASSLHIIYTSLRSDTRPCRYSVDTNLPDARFQSTRNMTRKVKGCPAALAANTVQDCVFASHTGSRSRQPQQQYS